MSLWSQPAGIEATRGGSSSSSSYNGSLLTAMRRGLIVVAAASGAGASARTSGGENAGVAPEKGRNRASEAGVRTAGGPAGVAPECGRKRRSSDAFGAGAETEHGEEEDVVGVDTLGLRRRLAPALLPFARGSLARACAAVASSARRQEAVREIEEGAFAKTTRRTNNSRWQTLRKLARTGSVALVPASVDTVKLMAGALRKGRYRSRPAYLSILKRRHQLAGFVWGPELEVTAKEMARSLQRGLGPAKRAGTVRLEEFLGREATPEPVTAGGSAWPLDCFAVAVFWMLRGAEAAALLVEQVSFQREGPSATLELGATKTNPEGRECRRTLRCACGGVTRRICPVHSLVRIVTARKAEGATGKHTLFAGSGGGAVPRRSWILMTTRVTGTLRLTEHSARRTGAQFYARLGVVVAIVQFLGRWGSDTVLRYVGEALHDRASFAACTAAAAAAASGQGSPAAFTAEDLRSMLRQLAEEVARDKFTEARPAAGRTVKSEPDSMQLGIRARVEELAIVIEKARSESRGLVKEQVEACLLEAWGGVRLSKSRDPRGSIVHVVEHGDVRVPVAMWKTRCGWYFGRSECVRIPSTEATCMSCLESVRSRVGIGEEPRSSG